MAMRGSGASKTLFWCDSYRQTIESVVLASGVRLSHITAKTHDYFINRPNRYLIEYKCDSDISSHIITLPCDA